MASQEQSNGTNKSSYDRVKKFLESKRMNAADCVNVGASTSAAGAIEIMQVDANAIDDDHLQCDRSAPESEVLLAKQHTMLWNEEHCVDIASGHHHRFSSPTSPDHRFCGRGSRVV
ncbi:hypothetical protein TNCV_3422171 [Trichonephila clavipes]|nr:hypothetical protein TNCV_3422171 [Trichonephila clavipes]